MPEGGADEDSHVVHQAWPLALDQSAVEHVVLKPEVDLVVPVLHHDLSGEAEFGLVDVDAVNLVELFFAVLVLAGIGDTRGDHGTVSDAPARVVEEPHVCNCEHVVCNLEIGLSKPRLTL